jgi:uncharacterized protein YjbI with pentapeptide repeats
MQIDSFKRIVTTFADPQTEILVERDRAVIQVNGRLIEVSLKQRSGEISVVDSGSEMPANQWILTRLAQLPLLADRLISTVPATKPFVVPEADLLESLEQKPGDESNHVADALSAALDVLDRRSPLETMVLYITSDAGEGKTSLINEMARRQAERFKDHDSDWLLVPIPLGGRHFLRFDDITVGALQNRYRFPFLYYNAFVELVRLGILIPAYDGFEEMFVENTSGEALSAMGVLVSSLQSCGAVVIAARKTYFEFQNLKTQARLRDLISSYLVGFGKLGLSRWKRPQFLAYCTARNLSHPQALYDTVVSRLGVDHSLITRPVLVRRLVDIAERSSSMDDVLTKLQTSGNDFFAVFVRSIVEREANEVWIDRSGEVKQPLLLVEEHCNLLSLIALEMWQSRVDFLKTDSVEFTTDYFCETNRKSPGVAAQIRERVKGHALLVASSNAQGAVEFDHDEFRQFFLGEAIANVCLASAASSASPADLLNILRKGTLPNQTFRSVVQTIQRVGATRQRQIVNHLVEVALMDGQVSFTQENCTSLVLALLSGSDGTGVVLRRMSFPPNALRDLNLNGVIFENCFFNPTGLDHSTLGSCRFERCHFTRLETFGNTRLNDVTLSESPVDVLFLTDRALTFFEPAAVRRQLTQLGFTVPEATAELPLDPAPRVERDDALVQFDKLLRCFMRSTHMSEGVIHAKLGGVANRFIGEVIPELLRAGILAEMENRGGGSQRHFRLGRQMVVLNRAMEESHGSFQRFIAEATRAPGSA